MRSLGKFVLAAVAFCASPFANAADMPSKTGYTPPVVNTTPWAGFYIGGHAGYGFGDIKSFEEFKVTPKGFVGGGQAGYNWQYGQLVAGVEVDATWLGSRDTVDGKCDKTVLIWTKQVDCSLAGKYDLIGSARVRVGSTILNSHILAYGTGGLAWAHTTVTATLDKDSSILGDNAFGWVAGGGLEFLLGNHWTARGEFLHYDFGSNPTAMRQTYNVVRGGLNFKF